MGIEDLKRWHWIAIGVVLGIVLAGARMMVDPDETDSADTRISAETFVYGVGHTTGGQANLPLFRNIVIYPPVNDLDYVTGEQLMPIPGTRKYQYKPISFHGTRPFRAAGRNSRLVAGRAGPKCRIARMFNPPRGRRGTAIRRLRDSTDRRTCAAA